MWRVGKGVRGNEFRFTQKEKENKPMIMDLGYTLLDLASTVPDGLLVFFPSYRKMRDFTFVWKTNGGNPSLFE